MNTARQSGYGSAGTDKFTLIVLGFAGRATGPVNLAVNEESWNGTSWTEVADLSTAHENHTQEEVGS